jgi:cysteine-rich secretory family protein
MRTLRQSKFVLACGVLCVGIWGVPRAAHGQAPAGQLVSGAGQQLMMLANQARAQTGAGPLQWDELLAAAARDHCLRMAAEGPIAHRYGGEDDLSTRAGKAGAHFNFIEENVAVATTTATIHEAWMQSPGHRSNLLNPEVDRVGIAVVRARGVLYATADYARGVQAMTQTEVEARVAGLIQASGLTILSDNAQARAACAADQGPAVTQGQMRPGFIMRWQDSEMDRLPPQLAEKLTSHEYHRAAVGSCPAQGIEGAFTAYRVAVLLY